ncbi:type I polyketide synthase [Actinoplanes sp. DH11]|uniref:type I polyketide synthase n=1 Tax=Actinoplanes sp. DH11 TaxID=2857011 RepID=UPI001E58DD08|nr:type I polyketide synthase [Actinoplanes sp. DH11]
MANEDTLRDYLKWVTADLHQTRQRLQDFEALESAPIAITAMSCRFPGGVRTPEELWQLVAASTDAISEFPGDRGWNVSSGQFASTEGGFLDDVASFDADFFGISPREALSMDPQQRLLLECSWEALESGGMAPHTLRGSSTGVFVGTTSQDYRAVLHMAPEASEGYALTGTAASILSGRIAYVLGLEGPALTVDTACSTSLVALHLAATALRRGECSLALAGGATVMSTPSAFSGFSEHGGLAADGRCKAFAATADGTAWAEGVGVLVLERLADARRNGHPVLATLRGSAVNSDGATNGLTAPNGPSQQRVILQALANAKLSAADVDVVEAHGTGTTLGDPIEAEALLATYGKDRPGGRPLRLGSVKSNIGHTQAAAGMAGVIKMVMAMRHDMLPRTLHISRPTSLVPWAAGGVRLLDQPVPWPRGGRTRRAGVSSFGMSGTNAHVIIEEPAEPAPETAPGDPDRSGPGPDWTAPVLPWVLSARSRPALRAQAARLLDHLAGAAHEPVDVAWSLVSTRSSLEHRAVVLDAGQLATLADGTPDPEVVTGVVSDGGVGLLFPGQGAQFAGMGEGLYRAYPVFAAVYDEVVAAFGFDIDAARLDETRFTQAALFAVEVATFRLLQSWGVRPDLLLGHSIGELAAAHVAGLWSLADAVKVVAARGSLMQALPTGGAMVAVAATEDEVVARLVDGVSIAAVNGPQAVVISGDEDAVLAVAAGFDKTRRLRVSHAFHSARMEPMLQDFAAVLDEVVFAAPSLGWVSNVTGQPVGVEVMDPQYWVRQVRQPVRFADGVAAMRAAGVTRFIEVGPSGALAAHVEDLCLPTLRKGRDEARDVVAALAGAHVHGVSVDWTAFFAGSGAQRIDLPTYAFQSQRYWPSAAGDAAGAADPADARFWDAVEREDMAAMRSAMDVEEEATALEPALPLLASWRRRRRIGSAVDAWRYRIVWKPVTVTRTARPAGVWWLLGEPGEPTDTLAAGLRTHGADVRILTGTADLAGQPEPAGIISLLALHRADDGNTAVPAGLARTDALIKALGAGAAPLWVLTRGAVSAGRWDAAPEPSAAMTWGYGRVAGVEFPQRWGGLLDLPDILDERAIDRICAILGARAEDQIAVRASGVFARRLVRAPRTTTPALTPWKPRGTVLITGGTGAIGRRMARWLAGAGAEHVVVTSRRGPDAPGADTLRDELTGLGVRVTVAACDVADRSAVTELVNRLRAGGETVTAVLHTAGVGQLSAIGDTDAAAFEQVVDAKVAGAVNLSEAFAGQPLDAFVLFSSIAAVWGSGGQGAYAAAGAYLDALAEQRRAAGLPATSVAWGVWGGGGMADGETSRHLSKRGLSPMDPDLARTALCAAVDHGEAAVTVADVDWNRFAPAFTAARPSPLLTGLPEVRDVLAEGVPAGDGTSFRERLAALSAADRATTVLDLVRAQAATALGLPSGDQLDPGRAFRDLGFDSITAVDLRTRLRAATGLDLPTTLVFDHPTAVALAEHLLAETFGGTADTGPVAVPAHATDDPVVIVGMSCRYPGGVRSPEQLWRLVVAGGDSIGPFPQDRGWDTGGLFGTGTGEIGVSSTSAGGFLDDATGFDAGFFGINPREALAMDPQQRQVLEVSWEALERAGIAATGLRGTRTGVFVGASPQGYGNGLTETPDGVAGYLMTGTATAVLAGRVAYTLALEGPAITVDTACSSSLTALHLAAQALRQGECDLALAGGVAVMATPGTFVEFSRQGGLARDGRCKSFAEAADGTGWSEGAGMLVVERLSDARRHGHDVLAVLRGSAVNSDGASNGLSAPSGPAQRRVIRQALAAAGLGTGDVDAVEGHGTGTTLGDPIEAQALLATYGQDRETPLYLGSIKSNIGHAQAAAGVAGIIKMVQAMRHGVLPRTLHVDEPTSHVDWTTGRVELLTGAREWPAADRPRRAAVSSFGVSGTNVHLILEEPPSTAPVPAGARPGPLPLTLSAHSAEALTEQAGALLDRLHSDPDADLTDVAYSLATGRTALEHRAAVDGRDRDDVLDGLRRLAAGAPSAALIHGRARPGVKVGLLLPGQGAQFAGMGAGLYAAHPVFADAFDAVCAELDQHLPRSVHDVVFAGGELLDDTIFTQAGLFAVEVAVVRLIESWGIRPDLLIGHSIGELSAAYLAGLWSLGDAARIVAARGRLMQALPAGGAMAAVQASETEVAALLTGGVSIAAINGAHAVVVSGDEAEVAALGARFEERGVKVRRLRVSHAFHSARLDPMLDDFAAVLGDVRFDTPSSGWVSNLTGRQAGVEAMEPSYWVDQVRRPVRFADAIATARAAGVGVFVEAGPSGTLTALAQHGDDTGETAYVPTLRRDRDEPHALAVALTAVYTSGVPVDWAAFYAGSGARRVDLPTYAFQHDHFWLAGARTGATNLAAAGLEDPAHPLVAAAVDLAGAGETFGVGRLSLDSHPWLGDHAVLGTVLLPGTAYVELALWAGAQAGTARIEELTIEAPLAVPEQGAVHIQVRAGAAGPDGRRTVTVHSRPDDDPDGWIRHAGGMLAPDTAAPPETPAAAWPPPGATPLPVTGLYEQLARIGYGYGPTFQGVTAAWLDGDDVCAEVTLPDSAAGDATRFGLHPALLDAALHAIGLARPDDAQSRLPFAWTDVTLYATGATDLRVRIRPAGGDGVTIDLSTGSGRPVATVGALVLRQVSTAHLDGARRGRQNPLLTLCWDPATEAGIAPPGVPDSAVAGRLSFPSPGAGPVADVHAVVQEAIRVLGERLGEEGAPLVVTTRHGVATTDGEDVDPAQAALAGLIRTAQAEHPGRILHVDLDDTGHEHLAAAAGTGRPQTAVRAGTVLLPRLVRAGDTAPVTLVADRTVLVTGASGVLGGQVARRLAGQGVRHLLLTGRRAPSDLTGLLGELTALGAAPNYLPCDLGDRAAVAALLDTVPADRPLGVVVHTAGIVADGVLATLTPEQVDAVLHAKADAAWHLHELTDGLTEFVLFSSTAGTLGSPGQANYAAANAFLDGLAAHRHATGRPARSIAWGPWAESGMLGRLGVTEVTRMARTGLVPLTADDGFDLFDAARGATAPVLLAARLAAGTAQVRADVVPPLLRGLIRMPARPAAARPGVSADDLRHQLVGKDAAAQDAVLAELVREAVVDVLGHPSGTAIEPGKGFLDIGFDSLTAVELRNRLIASTGLRLSTTLVFDHPSPAALATHLRGELVSDGTITALTLLADLDRLEAALGSVPPDDDDRSRVTDRLRGLLTSWSTGPTTDAATETAGRLDEVTADELFDLLDEELGIDSGATVDTTLNFKE